MSDFEIVAIEQSKLDRMRADGADGFGNPWQPAPSAGWEPLRCCLTVTVAEAGVPIVLVCYTPWTTPSPWLEAGPVFVHADRCAGYPTPYRYPPALAASHSMLNPFHADGSRAYEHITRVAPADDHEAALRAVLAHDDVDHLHVRSATAGCFTFAVRRS